MMNLIKSLLNSRKFIVTLIPLAVLFLNEAGFVYVTEDMIWQVVVSAGTLVAAIAAEDAAEKGSRTVLELVEDMDLDEIDAEVN